MTVRFLAVYEIRASGTGAYRGARRPGAVAGASPRAYSHGLMGATREMGPQSDAARRDMRHS
jgi:hypothetical protein